MCKKTVRIFFAALMLMVVGGLVLPKPTVCDAKSKMKFFHTKGKNKSDVKVIKKIIRENLRKDCYIEALYTDSEWSIYQYINLDSSKYQWNAKGRLVRFEMKGALKGNVSFSKLTKLKYLSVGECVEEERKGRIKSLDIKGCTSLEYLDCHGNKLTKLDLSHNKALQTLNCSSNQIQKLDLSKNKSLESLHCGNNILKKLYISNCKSLKEIWCSRNHFSGSFNIPDHEELVTLDCSGNKLSGLNVSSNAALKYLYCSDNKLKSIDISGCKQLESFHCSDNKLRSLDVSSNTALEYLLCYDNKLRNLDVSSNIALISVVCYDNLIASLNFTNNRKLQELKCDDTVKIFR